MKERIITKNEKYSLVEGSANSYIIENSTGSIILCLSKDICSIDILKKLFF